MTHRFLIATVQDLFWTIEPVGQQLSKLISSTHPYQPLLNLLARNIVEICIVLESNPSTVDFTTVMPRIAELICLIILIRDYVFDSVHDEIVDSHLTQIKESLEHIVGLITSSSSVQNELV